MPKRVQVHEVSEEEREQLERMSRCRTAPQRHVEGARIILGLLAGQKVDDVAAAVGRSSVTVYNQLHAFNTRGLDFVDDLPRAGRRQTY